MRIRRIDHVGVIVRDLAAARAFFVDLGLDVVGEGEVEGAWADRVTGLDGVKAPWVMLRTPDGEAGIEFISFTSPADDGAIQQLAVLAVLARPNAAMRQLRQPLTGAERSPARRTWERRLAALPTRLPDHSPARRPSWCGCWRRGANEAVASVSTTLAARGGVWHKKHRGTTPAPLTSIDTEAH